MRGGFDILANAAATRILNKHDNRKKSNKRKPSLQINNNNEQTRQNFNPIFPLGSDGVHPNPNELANPFELAGGYSQVLKTLWPTYVRSARRMKEGLTMATELIHPFLSCAF